MGDPRYLPTQESLSEFRNVLALAKAYHARNAAEVNLLGQLIDHPAEHLTALRSLVEMLLTELDTSKRDSNDVLNTLIENAAISDALPPKR